MAKKQPENKTTLYMRRVASNEYVQNQLRDAASALGSAYRRVARRRGQAVQDKQLYDHLREAATSIRNATRALQRRKPEPEPPRRGRKFLAVAVAGGGVVLVASKLGRQKASSDAAAGGAGSQ